jgi:LPXTG-motif cell wall-anchored protein
MKASILLPMFLLFFPTSAHADDLITATPDVVVVKAPAPGHSQTWEMKVRNNTDRPLPLFLEIRFTGDDLLVHGPTPLVLTVDTPDGRPLGEAALGQLPSSPTSLPDLPGGSTYVLHGTVSLPREAGNEYQRLSGKLTFEFTSEDDTTKSGTGQLPFTGSDGLWQALILGLGLLALGAALVAKRRGKRA